MKPGMGNENAAKNGVRNGLKEEEVKHDNGKGTHEEIQQRVELERYSNPPTLPRKELCRLEYSFSFSTSRAKALPPFPTPLRELPPSPGHGCGVSLGLVERPSGSKTRP